MFATGRSVISKAVGSAVETLINVMYKMYVHLSILI